MPKKPDDLKSFKKFLLSKQEFLCCTVSHSTTSDLKPPSEKFYGWFCDGGLKPEISLQQPRHGRWLTLTASNLPQTVGMVAADVVVKLEAGWS